MPCMIAFLGLLQSVSMTQPPLALCCTTCFTPPPPLCPHPHPTIYQPHAHTTLNAHVMHPACPPVSCTSHACTSLALRHAQRSLSTHLQVVCDRVVGHVDCGVTQALNQVLLIKYPPNKKNTTSTTHHPAVGCVRLCGSRAAVQ
jgi:hypothetical protein